MTRDGGRSAETSPDGGFLDSSHVESEGRGEEGGKKRNPEAASLGYATAGERSETRPPDLS